MKRGRKLMPGLAVFSFVAGLGGSTSAELASGDRSVFVPIVPCRLFDTRAGAPVGSRSTPLGEDGVMVQSVHGTNGNCSIPADATAVALNVTTANGTAASYLTLWPSDAARPLASNLNWTAGSAPTPNKVDVKLSADGRVSLYNHVGSVDVLADAVGYFVGHNHDDRYYTKGQIDTALAAKIDLLPESGQQSLLLGASAFSTSEGSNRFSPTIGAWAGILTTTSCVVAPLGLPDGVTVTDVSALVYDGNTTLPVEATVWRDPHGQPSATPMGSASTGGASAPGLITATGAVTTNNVVDLNAATYFVDVCGITSSSYLADVTIVFVVP